VGVGILVLMGLSGCADLANGPDQEVIVYTSPNPGAQCQLKNALGTWNVAQTPGAVLLTRSTSPLIVDCMSEDGATGKAIVESDVTTAGWSNVIAGKVVGGMVNANTPSAYVYPDKILVPMASKGLPTPITYQSESADISNQLQPLSTESSIAMAAAAPAMPGTRPNAKRSTTPPPDEAAVEARRADDNVASRFQTLRLLLDEGLITNEEYNIRRGANLGALLRYSLIPGATDLTRPPPPPPQVLARLKYLGAAYVERSITAAEQAAERSVILEGLLPAKPQKRADPPPPIKDHLQLAAEIGRLERLKIANVITEKEALSEKAKVTALLDAKIAADDAAARAAAGVKVTNLMPGMMTGIGVALSTHSSENQAKKIWAGLQKVYPEDLGNLQMQLKKIPRPHRPSHYRITAGPLTDMAGATALCKTLKRRGVACEPTKLGE
jgi:hypothetical protein